MKPASIEVIRRRIQQETPLTVLTGAGASAESGVPTFRGEGGFWRSHRATDLATPGAFRADPKLVWDFYQYRRRALATCKPNYAHAALAEYEARKKDTWIITQNVDGLHQQAGSKNVIEMHGSLWQVRCTQCAYRAENRDLDFDEPPHCPVCSALLRPSVVWFGEALDPVNLNRIYPLLGRGGILLVVGTSGVVAPASEFAALARRSGAFTVEVNPDSTAVETDMDEIIRDKAGAVLPELLR